MGWSRLGVHRKGLSKESLLLIKLLPEVRGRSWRWVVDMREGGMAEPEGCHCPEVSHKGLSGFCCLHHSPPTNGPTAPLSPSSLTYT